MENKTNTYTVLMANVEKFHNTVLRSDIVKLANQIDQANSEGQLEPPVVQKIADTDWMPVEDLPDDNSGYYLCYTKYIYNDDKPQYFYETARIEDRQWYAPNGENITDNVIYWKELPKAPH